MGICDCGRPTVWIDLCEICLEEYEKCMFSDFDIGERVDQIPPETIMEISSNDTKLMTDLIDWLNNYKPTEGRDTTITIKK